MWRGSCRIWRHFRSHWLFHIISRGPTSSAMTIYNSPGCANFMKCLMAPEMNTVLISKRLNSLKQFFLKFFYFRERERAQVCVSRGEELRGRRSPTRDSIPRPWDHDLSPNQESDAQLSHPGTPQRD